MIKAVIFDMDGLIVDSEPIESLALEILLKRYGKVPVYNEVGLIHSVGIGMGKDGYNSIKEIYKIEEEVAIIKRKKRGIFTRLVKRNLTPRKEFFPLIEMLKERKIKTALASNRHRRHVRIMVSSMQITHLFDSIVAPTKRIRHKPAPDTYLWAARKLKIDPPECIVLEDSEIGVISGKDAGMKVIAVPNIYTKNQDFSKADLVVNSLKEIEWSTILNI